MRATLCVGGSECDHMHVESAPASAVVVRTNASFELSHRSRVAGEACELAAASLKSCKAYEKSFPDVTVSWWCGSSLLITLRPLTHARPGAIFLPPTRMSQETCQSYCAVPGHHSPDACEAAVACSEPLCPGCDQTACERSGHCTAEPGCFFPLRGDGGCDLAHIRAVLPELLAELDSFGDVLGRIVRWTPEGCLVRGAPTLMLNAFTCASLGGRYRSHAEWAALNETTCLALATPRCTDMEARTLPFVGVGTWAPQSTAWLGTSAVSAATCADCGQKMVPAYRWVPGRWQPLMGAWRNLAWVPRRMGNDTLVRH